MIKTHSKSFVADILSDPHQVLFKPCNYASRCKRPVVFVSENTACLYHGHPTTIDYRLPNRDEVCRARMITSGSVPSE